MRLSIGIAFALLLAVGSAHAQTGGGGQGAGGGAAQIACTGGNVVTSTVPPGTCGSAASSGVVNAGTTNQLALYPGNGTTVGGLATCNNGVYQTNGAGVPARSSTLASGLSATSITLTSPTINGSVGGSAFGTAAFVNTGGSGSAVCLLSSNCTFSGVDNFTGTFQLGGFTVGAGGNTTLAVPRGSTQCLHENTAGVISGTGTDC